MDHVFRRLSFKDLLKESPVSAGLVIINVVVYVFGLIYQLMGNGELVYELGINRTIIEFYGQYYRLFTAGFAHFDLIHLLFNVWFGIYVLSAGLERLIGSVRFAFVYFIGLIGSSLVVFFLVDDTTVVDGITYLTTTAGASGAIFTVIGSLLFITFVRPDMISRQESASIRNLVLINIIFTFAISNISVAGHLGGLVIGLIISYIFIPKNRNFIEDHQVYDYTNNDDQDDWWVN